MTCEQDHASHGVRLTPTITSGDTNDVRKKTTYARGRLRTPTITSSDSDDVRTKTTHRTRHDSHTRRTKEGHRHACLFDQHAMYVIGASDMRVVSSLYVLFDVFLIPCFRRRHSGFAAVFGRSSFFFSVTRVTADNSGVDAVLETMRDASGVVTWHNLRDRLVEAMQRASNLNLFGERKVLGDVIARGTQMESVIRNPAGIQGVLSQMLPSIRGVSQRAAEADMAKMRKLQLTHRNQFSVLGAAGYGGAASTGVAYRGGFPAVRSYGEVVLAGGGARASGRKH